MKYFVSSVQEFNQKRYFFHFWLKMVKNHEIYNCFITRTQGKVNKCDEGQRYTITSHFSMWEPSASTLFIAKNVMTLLYSTARMDMMVRVFQFALASNGDGKTNNIAHQSKAQRKLKKLKKKQSQNF